jgi:hypothetical protein
VSGAVLLGRDRLVPGAGQRVEQVLVGVRANRDHVDRPWDYMLAAAHGRVRERGHGAGGHRHRRRYRDSRGELSQLAHLLLPRTSFTPVDPDAA